MADNQKINKVEYLIKVCEEEIANAQSCIDQHLANIATNIATEPRQFTYINWLIGTAAHKEAYQTLLDWLEELDNFWSVYDKVFQWMLSADISQTTSEVADLYQRKLLDSMRQILADLQEMRNGM